MINKAKVDKIMLNELRYVLDQIDWSVRRAARSMDVTEACLRRIMANDDKPSKKMCGRIAYFIRLKSYQLRKNFIC